MKRKWFVRGGSCGAGLFILAAIYCWWSYSPGATVYASERAGSIELSGRLRTWPEHDALYPAGTDPYVLELESGAGSLLYYGAKHSNDPDHPQRADIERRWRGFQPTVALCEGRSRGEMIGVVFEWLGGLSENVLVHRLARRSGVPLYSLEPQYEAEVARLLERWPAELVALFFTMRGYWAESGGPPDDGPAATLLARRTDDDGLWGSISSVEELDRVWKEHFSDLPGWRALSQEPEHPLLGEIADASREARGEHMVRTLVDLVRKGERVLAVVGCSHVIRQEPMLREALEARPASDQ